MPPIKHTHMYQRVEPRKKGSMAIYRCALPGCTHTMPETQILSKISLCNRCKREEFVITKRLAFFPRTIQKLHCEKCFRPTFNRKTGLMQVGSTKIATAAGLSEDQMQDVVGDLLTELGIGGDK